MDNVQVFEKKKLSVPVLFTIFLGACVLATLFFVVQSFSFFLWFLLVLVFFIGGLFWVSYYVEGRRSAKNRLMIALVVAAFLLAIFPLLSLLFSVLSNGLPGLSKDLFFYSMNGVTGSVDKASVENGTPVLGGAYHAIVGTFLITAMATLLSVPVGLLTSVYLVEYGRGNRFSRVVTFFVDVMTGVPSIVAGLFAYAFFAWLFGAGTQVGFVGSVALSVLMIPTVVRSSEEMLRIVPNELREAAFALGVPKWKTIVKIVIPTAISGIASGVTLAIARVVGETAPLLVTAGFATTINFDLFKNWMASLPVFIYTQALQPTSPQAPEPSFQRAWAAALVLILFVMVLNFFARLVARVFAPKSGR